MQIQNQQGHGNGENAVAQRREAFHTLPGDAFVGRAHRKTRACVQIIREGAPEYVPKSSNVKRPDRHTAASGAFEEYLLAATRFRNRIARDYGLSVHRRREQTMRADRVELSWDPAKSQWLVRIQNGEEVIRRHCKTPKDADEQTLRSAAAKTVQDEGYELDPATVSIHR
jgi:hypothetical protein